ncbi:hypothetical protein B1812_20760 [Methylocystis bryophila]|uniref:Uncharacterized protein n=1 Tax=Methylocystis bryophila TaxID=655015 RepID=A0A1W6MZU7_9HYPH|nr:hypothetical protein B1812_20760 [Methylocystis bryophila]
MSITMETALCIETIQDAFVGRHWPEFFNTNHGSQFTSTDSNGVLLHAIATCCGSLADSNHHGAIVPGAKRT